MNFYVFRNNCQSLVVPIDVSMFIIDHIFFLLFNLSRLERNTNKTDNKKLVEFAFSIKTNKNQFSKKKYSDSFFSHLKYYIMQNPVNSTGSVLKQNSLSICNFACSKVLISKSKNAWHL